MSLRPSIVSGVLALFSLAPLAGLASQNQPEIPRPQSRASAPLYVRVAPYAAWTLIVGGALLLALSASRMIRRRPDARQGDSGLATDDDYADEGAQPEPYPGLDADPTDEASGAPGAAQPQAVRIHGDAAGLIRNPPPVSAPNNAAQYVSEYEQERWNLPGFLSALAPIRRRLNAAEFDPAAQFERALDASDGLFNFRYYRYHDAPGFPDNAADLESFSKSFLNATLDAAGRGEATLYLRTRSGRYRACLRRLGGVYISGAALQESELSPHIIRRFEEGKYLALEDGCTLYFPVPSRYGALGAMRLTASEPLLNPELIARVWFEIRKYGETLLQACIFEQATSDPASATGNGFLFQRDLKLEFSMRREWRDRRALWIVRFTGRSRLERADQYGYALRSELAPPCRLYRIAADAFAGLGPEIPESELDRRFAAALARIREREAVDIAIGCAILEEDVSSSSDWFRRAGLALEQAEAEGANSYRIYESAQKTPVFAEHGSLT